LFSWKACDCAGKSAGFCLLIAISGSRLSLVRGSLNGQGFAWDGGRLVVSGSAAEVVRRHKRAEGQEALRTADLEIDYMTASAPPT